MYNSSVFRVYNPVDGRFIVEGTASECAKKLGITEKSFRWAAERFKKGDYKKYNIYDVSNERESTVRECDRDVIKAWDDFVTPIRERFGIPVYRGEWK